MKRPEKRQDAAILVEALGELSNMATGAAMLAEMAENDPDLRIRMPSVLRAVCRQLSERLMALAKAVDGQE